MCHNWERTRPCQWPASLNASVPQLTCCARHCDDTNPLAAAVLAVVLLSSSALTGRLSESVIPTRSPSHDATVTVATDPPFHYVRTQAAQLRSHWHSLAGCTVTSSAASHGASGCQWVPSGGVGPSKQLPVAMLALLRPSSPQHLPR